MSIPTYQQLDSMDCGSTCLRIIAKYYGRSFSAARMRELCHTTREGVSMLGISDAAESMGFRTAGVKITWEQLLNDVPLPCIAHWNQQHFIVVYKIKKDKVYVSDPATGLLELYDRKNALVAADMLNDRVVPFFEQHDLKLMRMLTDRGTEYCGNRENHEYELYLAVEDIDHTKIKAKSPQTNGICERFNRTVQNEFYAIAFRKKIYTSIEQLQTDLDAWMNSYNTERTHSGKYCFGKTPMQTFIEGIAVARKYQLQNLETIKPNDVNKMQSGCESEESCVNSQQITDSFFVR